MGAHFGVDYTDYLLCCRKFSEFFKQIICIELAFHCSTSIKKIFRSGGKSVEDRLKEGAARLARLP